jgi:hypothetical protein
MFCRLLLVALLVLNLSMVFDNTNNTTTGTAISGETNSIYSSLNNGRTIYYYCVITLSSGVFSVKIKH